MKYMIFLLLFPILLIGGAVWYFGAFRNPASPLDNALYTSNILDGDDPLKHCPNTETWENYKIAHDNYSISFKYPSAWEVTNIPSKTPTIDIVLHIKGTSQDFFEGENKIHIIKTSANTTRTMSDRVKSFYEGSVRLVGDGVDAASIISIEKRASLFRIEGPNRDANPEHPNSKNITVMVPFDESKFVLNIDGFTARNEKEYLSFSDAMTGLLCTLKSV